MTEYIGNRFAQAAGCLSPPMFSALSGHFTRFEHVAQEIRLRSGRPVAVVCPGKTVYLTQSGGLTDLPNGDLLIARREDIEATFQRICDYSVYARKREIINGFVTLRGGHRAGICGTAVADSSDIVNVRDITSINLRIAREHIGCANGIFQKIKYDNGGVLLCGAPCTGKTTLLRDLARLLSTAEGTCVSLIDERGELAAVTSGVPQNDVGMCDVFDGYPKAQALEQALRSMSPDVIICDEIGSEQDVHAVHQCVNSGVRLIATAHARSKAELYSRPKLKRILSTGAFSTFIFLRDREHAGEVLEVLREGVKIAA